MSTLVSTFGNIIFMLKSLKHKILTNIFVRRNLKKFESAIPIDSISLSVIVVNLSDSRPLFVCFRLHKLNHASDACQRLNDNILRCINVVFEFTSNVAYWGIVATDVGFDDGSAFWARCRLLLHSTADFLDLRPDQLILTALDA